MKAKSLREAAEAYVSNIGHAAASEIRHEIGNLWYKYDKDLIDDVIDYLDLRNQNDALTADIEEKYGIDRMFHEPKTSLDLPVFEATIILDEIDRLYCAK